MAVPYSFFNYCRRVAQHCICKDVRKKMLILNNAESVSKVHQLSVKRVHIHIDFKL